MIRCLYTNLYATIEIMRGKRYVGFGMGPIQAGLMLLEAQESGNFAAYCIAETNAELLHLLRTLEDLRYVSDAARIISHISDEILHKRGYNLNIIAFLQNLFQYTSINAVYEGAYIPCVKDNSLNCVDILQICNAQG